MVFNKIIIKNFKSYGDYDTIIDLNNKGALFIIGNNGAGKSAFVDAILYAIYGRTPSAVDEIVNRTTGKNCKVALSFIVNADEYRIIRFRNDDDYYNGLFFFKNKENLTLRKVNDTQKLILDTVQILYTTMINSVLFSSELYTSFLRSTTGKRLSILENLLSIKEIEKYQRYVFDLRKGIVERLNFFNNNRDRKLAELNTLTRTLEEYSSSAKDNIRMINGEIKHRESQKKEILKTKSVEVDIDEEFNCIKRYNETSSNNNNIRLNIKLLENKKENVVRLKKEKKDIEKELINKDCPLCKQEIINSEDFVTTLKLKLNKLNVYIEKIISDNIKIDKKIMLEKEKIGDLILPQYDEKELNKLKLVKEKYDKIINKVDSDINLLKEKINLVYDRNFINNNKNKIKILNKEIDVLKEQVKEIKYEKNHYDVLGDLFSNNKNSIKKIIIEERIGYFNNRINFYLPIFFDKNVKIMFDKNLNEKIYVNNMETSFGSFSSGEKMRIELSVAFSLFSLVRMFFHVPINLLIFDELLDHSLDKIGVEKVLEVINNLSKDSSVIIISHNQNYTENYLNKIFIYKDNNGYSRLEREDLLC